MKYYCVSMLISDSYHIWRSWRFIYNIHLHLIILGFNSKNSTYRRYSIFLIVFQLQEFKYILLTTHFGTKREYEISTFNIRVRTFAYLYYETSIIHHDIFFGKIFPDSYRILKNMRNLPKIVFWSISSCNSTTFPVNHFKQFRKKRSFDA